MQQHATSFPVLGTRVHGFFHLPDNSEGKKLPLIVMFNGYATEWQFGTSAFIERFTEMGFATLNFDYRGFGNSEGEPRQLMDIPAQLQDCAAAIAHGLVQDWVDETRLLVWGSSLGGGHAISMAAEFDQVAGMIAQVPHCCSRAAFKTIKLSAVLTGMSQAILDAVGNKLGAAPRMIPILAEPDQYAVLNHPGWYQHYMAIAKDSKTWHNAIPARSLLRGADYRPVLQAEKIRCPVLLVAGNTDAGVPIDSVKDAAARIPKVQLHIYEGGHFDVYGGELQADIISRQQAFLQAFTDQ